jgi:hypothetical protein
VPLVTLLALPFPPGSAGLLIVELDKLHKLVGATVVADGNLAGCPGLGRRLGLAELGCLALGVDDLPLGRVHPVLGELGADGADILEDLLQGIAEGVNPALPALQGDLDLGVISFISVHVNSPFIVAGLSPRLVLAGQYRKRFGLGGKIVATLHARRSRLAPLGLKGRMEPAVTLPGGNRYPVLTISTPLDHRL